MVRQRQAHKSKPRASAFAISCAGYLLRNTLVPLPSLMARVLVTDPSSYRAIRRRGERKKGEGWREGGEKDLATLHARLCNAENAC